MVPSEEAYSLSLDPWPLPLPKSLPLLRDLVPQHSGYHHHPVLDLPCGSRQPSSGLLRVFPQRKTRVSASTNGIGQWGPGVLVHHLHRTQVPCVRSKVCWIKDWIARGLEAWNCPPSGVLKRESRYRLFHLVLPSLLPTREKGLNSPISLSYAQHFVPSPVISSKKLRRNMGKEKEAKRKKLRGLRCGWKKTENYIRKRGLRETV